MAEEKYYKLGLLQKTRSGAAWEYIYFKVYDCGGLEITHKEISNLLNSKLEKITKEDHAKIINDSNHDFSYG
ncbi:MAG: hypothetical protein Q8O84_01525 [Nanoarchaeota archaeon]|nr:hypothetical protein [Nanoarchaeota archaeon]